MLNNGMHIFYLTVLTPSSSVCVLVSYLGAIKSTFERC